MPINEGNPLRDPLWERQRYETRRQFMYFKAYRDLPYGFEIEKDDGETVKSEPMTRTLREVSKLFTISETRIRVLSADWEWVKRVRAFDDEQERIESEERQRVRREYARTMERRAMQYREDAAGLYPQILGKIHQMLQFPLSEAIEIEEIGEDGKGTGEIKIIIKPIDWNAGTLPRFVTALENLARFAAGIDLQGAYDKLLERIDPANLTPEQRQRIINGEDIVNVIFDGGTTPIQGGSARSAIPARIEDNG